MVGVAARSPGLPIAVTATYTDPASSSSQTVSATLSAAYNAAMNFTGAASASAGRTGVAANASGSASGETAFTITLTAPLQYFITGSRSMMVVASNPSQFDGSAQFGIYNDIEVGLVAGVSTDGPFTLSGTLQPGTYKIDLHVFAYDNSGSLGTFNPGSVMASGNYTRRSYPNHLPGRWCYSARCSWHF